MGNICRSPTAEGVFRKVVEDAGMAKAIRIDSAGTHAYHTGEPPDRRAQAAALSRGYVLSDIRARRVSDEDFAEFEIIVAMDDDNLLNLRDREVEDSISELKLFLEFSGSHESEVPDPYYGGASGFERVLDLVEDASRGLLEHIRKM
jgi:protein-tyrosine phosphatase